MDNVIQFPRFERDGGKARIKRHRDNSRRTTPASGYYPNFSVGGDLAMDHADPECVRPSELA